MDSSRSRPQSMEGPADSGISINGDAISSPDSDTSLLSQQSQHVSFFYLKNLVEINYPSGKYRFINVFHLHPVRFTAQQRKTRCVAILLKDSLIVKVKHKVN